jgi:hypothetical protein
MRVDTHTCDDCGTEAPEGHCSSFPRLGWIGLRDSASSVEPRDFCSAACLAAWSTGLAAERCEFVNCQPRRGKRAGGPVRRTNGL